VFTKWKNRAAPDIILIVSGVLIIFVIPEFSFFPTGCLFYKTTGFYCAGCGISRCLHSLLRGDFPGALHQNLLILTLFPFSALWLILRRLNWNYSEKIKTYDKVVIAFLIISVLIFTILRNLPLPCFNFLRP